MEKMEEQDQVLNINAALAENLEAYIEPVEGEDKKEAIAQIDYKMVTFSLAGRDYAIDIMRVKEIVKANQFTYVPNTLPFVRGVYNLRGEIIPIIDMRRFFNIEVTNTEENPLENMLIVLVGEQVFGVVVDLIDKVVGIQSSTIQPPHPLFGDINIKYIQGIVEVNNRLYVLLDIERIFSSKIDYQSKEEEAARNMLLENQESVGKMAAPQPAVQKKPVEKQPVPSESIDLTFIKESLSQMRKFIVSDVNENWVKARFEEWRKERGKDNTQLANASDADEYLKTFYSSCSNAWWKKEYADAVFKCLPDNSAKQIVVWNPGCGKGYETYSLACLLMKRYPEAKIKIYAHDVDLLSVSNASLLSIPSSVANDWYAPYITTTASGEYTFSPEIKSSIMFEYHDCANTNALPVVDIIFARDLLSFLPLQTQASLTADFLEKLKGNGITIIGENESLDYTKKWIPTKTGTITVYKKQ